MMTYIDVALAKVHTNDKLFTYKYDDKVSVGDIIKAPYGKKQCYGIVLGIVKKPSFKTREIKETLDISLPTSSIELMRWMFDFYIEDNGLITSLFIPPNIGVSTRNDNYQPLTSVCNYDSPKLTTEQQMALKIINKSNKVLLHGDTGTGKTRVYIEAAQKCLNRGESILLLTPEIGLTPQLIDDFNKHLDYPIAHTHSELTPSNRKKVWGYAYKNRKASIFVGPRSALFLPIKKIGLIVMDEFHDSSYKQNQSPRFQSLHLAAKLADIHKSKIILGSATPNVDDYKMLEKTGYEITRLKQLAAGQQKSEGIIIDIKNRDKFKTNPYLSDDLIDAIKKALHKKEQVMLFFNRRGTSRLIQCRDCGWQELCPNCGIPLVYHRDFHKIICHSCNHKKSAPSSCINCSSSNILFKNIGVKSIVDDVNKLFPEAVVKRFDADSSSENKYFKNIEMIKKGDVDIIIGTQIITKGIDLPSLSVVGIIDADTSLNLPDFRSEETAFQQLFQVTGRVARGHKLSKYFIQSRTPDNSVIKAVKLRSWDEFYKSELAKRRQFNYPPYCFLGLVKVNKTNPKAAEKYAGFCFDILSKVNDINVIGPSPSFFEKLASQYCWQIIIKSKKRSNIIRATKLLPTWAVVDIDPISLL
jgi:primosomal protein N' (replication factor Y)